MKKNSTPQSSHTKGATPSDTETAFLSYLFSLLPPEVIEEANAASEKSTRDFLERLGRCWEQQQQAFANYKIKYMDIFTPLSVTGIKFFGILPSYQRAERYVSWSKRKTSLRALSLLIQPEALLPSPLKEVLRLHVGFLTVPSWLPDLLRLQLERLSHLPNDTKNIDLNAEKSLHKQPMFVAVLNDLFTHLKKNGVTTYRATRLLYGLWIAAGIIRTPQDCNFASFKRNLYRLQQQLSRTTPVGHDKLSK